MDAQDLFDVLQAVDLRELASEATAQNTGRIADLNAGQLARGYRATGSEILPAYRPLTIQIKSTLGGLAGVTDHVTLFHTGAFYKSLYAEVRGQDVEYGARNWKAEKLAKKYQPSIFGLTTDSQDDLVTHYLRGDSIELLRDKTGL